MDLSQRPRRTTLQQLPEATLVRVLQRVPLRQRLGRCALVSRTWAVAAAAATTKVEVTLATAKVPAFEAWLQQHGQQLVSIKASASGPHRCPMMLPCVQLAQLQTLHLCRIQVQLPGRGDGAGSSSTLPSLRALSVWCSDLPTSGIPGLQLQQLTSLDLHSVGCERHLAGEEKRYAAAAAALLQGMPLLSRLSTGDLVLDAAARRPLSCMAALQDCNIQRGDPSILAGLPSSLTALNFNAASYRVDGPTRAAAALPAAGWPLLRHLRLAYVKALNPAGLAGLRRLQELDLEGCTLVPAAAGAAMAGMVDAPAGEVALAAAATADFMAAVAHLTHLSWLCLENVTLTAVNEQQVQQLSALSAAPGLEGLKLVNTAPWGGQLPPAALQHLLPPGRVMRKLTLLQLKDEGTGGAEEVWVRAAADLDHIAAACPVLSDLTFDTRMAASREALSSLLSLQRNGLDALDLGWPLFDDAAASSTLTQMTTLRHLVIRDADSFTDAGLARLTALTRLEWLWVCECALSEPLCEDSNLALSTGEAAEPDVWRQLDALLDSSPDPCVVQLRLRELRSGMAQLRERVAQLEAALQQQATGG